MDNGMLAFYKAALQGEITAPLCAEYKTEWRKCGDDKEKLVKLVMRQQSLPYFITHCYQGKGLSKEYILKNFSDFINGKAVINDADGVDGYTYEMWVGVSDFFIKPQTDVSAYMWANNMTLRINETKCPTIYIGCGSCIKISPEGYNSIHIYLFDDSRLIIDDYADDTCSIVVYRYSRNATVEKGKYCTTDNIKIFDKELRL